jgi:hypothetical protein
MTAPKPRLPKDRRSPIRAAISTTIERTTNDSQSIEAQFIEDIGSSPLPAIELNERARLLVSRVAGTIMDTPSSRSMVGTEKHLMDNNRSFDRPPPFEPAEARVSPLIALGILIAGAIVALVFALWPAPQTNSVVTDNSPRVERAPSPAPGPTKPATPQQ